MVVTMPLILKRLSIWWRCYAPRSAKTWRLHAIVTALRYRDWASLAAHLQTTPRIRLRSRQEYSEFVWTSAWNEMAAQADQRNGASQC
jgi:hypothetical protein